MSLGKRPRPPMRRTTSLTEFAPDLIVSDPNPDPNPNPAEAYLHRHPHPMERKRVAVEEAAAVPPPVQHPLPPPPPPEKRQVVVFLKAIEAAEFLRACGICKRRLGPGKDTFIYRGDAAFCSLECREKQIKLDERKEKCSTASMKSKAPPPKAGTEGNGSSETVAAA